MPLVLLSLNSSCGGGIANEYKIHISVTGCVLFEKEIHRVLGYRKKGEALLRFSV